MFLIFRPIEIEFFYILITLKPINFSGKNHETSIKTYIYTKVHDYASCMCS